VIALTFDDGFCVPCVSRIVSTLDRTHAHATIFPNGRYGRSWDPVAGALRRLIARHQLTIGNHTFSHTDPRAESASALATDLNRNETWIERTFGVTARPFFRPPYGSYNAQTLAVAGRLGYTKVVLWSGTLADSTPHDRTYIVRAIRHWAHPGTIMLMHGNYPTTAQVLPQILRVLEQRHLKPVTLDELLRAARKGG
jgi:peptidoglycan/xylan/chitin deacetylase (PgdA/CDA1 family)